MTTLAIQNPRANSATSHDPFYVLPDSRFDVILGLDWLQRHRMILDLADHQYTSGTFGDLHVVGTSTRNDPDAETALALMVSEVRPVEDPLDDGWNTAPEFDELDVDEEVSPEELLLIPPEYRQFADVFSKKRSEQLPPHREGIDLTIDLQEGWRTKLGRAKCYQMSKPHRDFLGLDVKKKLKNEFIAHSKSQIASPGFFVPKVEGEPRFVVDYKLLNSVTEKDRYGLPLISDIFSAAGGKKFYSKIDLRGAYNLLRIAPGHEYKTAFTTVLGTFEYRVMPFGLSNAPPAFQRWMNSIFQDLMPLNAMVYLDDILLYSNDADEHHQLILDVLTRLRANRLYASPKKCEFMKTTLQYLGHVLTPEGLKMTDEKVRTILDWPEPRTVKEIQRFLGFANFYRRFIDGFQSYAQPLSNMTRQSFKDANGIKSDYTKFVLTDEARAGFHNLLHAFTTAPVLVPFDPARATVVETDASNFAIGAVLSQSVDDELRPVAYFSRSFQPAELNYDVHDKELLGVVEALRHWRYLLLGTDIFAVRTDHKNLVAFTAEKELSPRQVRWSLFLNQFHFEIHYQKGLENGRCDALSRRNDHLDEVANHPLFAPQNQAAEKGAKARTRPDTTVVGRLFPTAVHRPSAGEEVATVTPLNTITTQYSRFSLDDDPLTQEIKAEIRRLSAEDRKTLIDSKGCYHRKPDTELLWYRTGLYVPDKPGLRTRALQAHHDLPTMGHVGTRKTLANLHCHYAWPNDGRDVEQYVKSCIQCQSNKPSRRQPLGPLRPLELPEKPWQSVTMDRITQLPPSNGYTSILVIVDRFTKYGVFLPVKENFDAPALADLFYDQILLNFGTPREVISDRGPEFAAQLWREICRKLEITSKLSTAYHPQTDGQTERVNQTLEIYLRHYVNYHQDNWSKLLRTAAFCYNTTEHSATRKTPCMALFNFTPSLAQVHIAELGLHRSEATADDTWRETKRALEEAQESSRRYYDRNRQPLPDWKTGDKVMLSTRNLNLRRPTRKLAQQALGPFEVVEKISTHAYRLKLPSTMKVHNVFSITELRPFHDDTSGSRVQEPPQSVEVDGELEYQIEAIVATRIRQGAREYLVKWSGYTGDESQTWEPEQNVLETQALNQFENAQAARSRRARN